MCLCFVVIFWNWVCLLRNVLEGQVKESNHSMSYVMTLFIKSRLRPDFQTVLYSNQAEIVFLEICVLLYYFYFCRLLLLLYYIFYRKLILLLHYISNKHLNY